MSKELVMCCLILSFWVEELIQLRGTKNVKLTLEVFLSMKLKKENLSSRTVETSILILPSRQVIPSHSWKFPINSVLWRRTKSSLFISYLLLKMSLHSSRMPQLVFQLYLGQLILSCWEELLGLQESNFHSSTMTLVLALSWSNLSQ